MGGGEEVKIKEREEIKKEGNREEGKRVKEKGSMKKRGREQERNDEKLKRICLELHIYIKLYLSLVLTKTIYYFVYFDLVSCNLILGHIQ